MLKKIVNLVNLPLKSLRTDLGTQSRYLASPKKRSAYQQILEHYADSMRKGLWRWQESPPLVFGKITYLGSEIYVPGDGHTRIEAARSVGFDTILCETSCGTAVDALRYSLGPANRNYLANKLDADDIAYRVHLTLQDRQMWCWTDRRILDYCDDGNRQIKLRKVSATRDRLLAQWQVEQPNEYQWRKSQLDRPGGLFEIGADGVEFPSNYPRHIKQSPCRVNPQDLSKLAYTTAQFRAAQVGCSVERWIENAVLLADRTLSTSVATTVGTLYHYRGQPNYFYVYDRDGQVTELGATILDGYQLELLETPIDCPDELLPVRLLGCTWDAHLHLRIHLDSLEWLTPD